MSRSRGKKDAAQAEAVVPLSHDEAGARAGYLVAYLSGHPDARGIVYGLQWAPLDMADVLVERVVLAEQLISWARSQQLSDLAALGTPGSYGSYVARMPFSELDAIAQAELEISGALTLSRRQASTRLDDAGTLSTLPRVMGLLRSGLIDQVRAEAISRSMNEYLQPSDDPAEDQARWDQVDEKVTARAPSRTAAMLRHDVARAALTADPGIAERRRVKAREDREVRMFRRPDGMTGIEGLLDAESAAIIDTTLTLLADAQRDMAARAGMPDERTHAQRRADALTGVFRAIADGRSLRMYPLSRPDDHGCADPGPEPGFNEDSRYIPACFIQPSSGDDADGGGDGACHAEPAVPVSPPPVAVPAWWDPAHLPRQQRRRPHLVVTIHAETLAGRDDLPGELAGYGAITAQAARDLARQCGTADLVILDPAPGSTPDCTPACRSGPDDPSAADPDAPPPRSPKPVPYKPRDQLIRDVIARHRTCRAPGCARPAGQCDLDHVIPFGREKRTCACNLIPLCRRHHRIKTFTDWTITLNPPRPGDAAGDVEWTSPTGRRYTVPSPGQPGTPGW